MVKPITITTRENLLKKVLNSNQTIDALLKMNRIQYNKALGKNIKTNNSLKAQKRNLNALRKEPDIHIDLLIKKDYGKNKTINEAVRKASYDVIYPRKSMIKARAIPKKAGQYITTKLKTSKDGKFKYIKASNRKSFNKQLKTLESNYGKTFLLSSSKPIAYTPFVSKGIQKNLAKYGIFI